MNQQTLTPPEEQEHTPPELPSSHPSQGPQQRIPVKLPDSKPIVTYTLLAITVLIFLAQLGTETFLGIDLPAVYGLKVNQFIADGQLWRLFTPIFLHGDIIHIGFNMYALFRIGPQMERYYGHSRFLGLYLLSGFGGNVFSFMLTDSPSLGSSTAIFGLIAAQGIFFYHNREVFGPAVRRALNSIISIAVINLLIGLSPGIDNWGHVGGLIGGALFAWIGGPLLKVTGSYPNLSLADRRDPSQILQAHIIVAAIFSLLSAGAIFLM